MLLNSNSKNTSSNLNTKNQNSSSKKPYPNKSYLESFNSLKSKLDNTIQSKQSSSKKNIEKVINISPLNSPKLKGDA